MNTLNEVLTRGSGAMNPEQFQGLNDAYLISSIFRRHKLVLLLKIFVHKLLYLLFWTLIKSNTFLTCHNWLTRTWLTFKSSSTYSETCLYIVYSNAVLWGTSYSPHKMWVYLTDTFTCLGFYEITFVEIHSTHVWLHSILALIWAYYWGQYKTTICTLEACNMWHVWHIVFY